MLKFKFFFWDTLVMRIPSSTTSLRSFSSFCWPYIRYRLLLTLGLRSCSYTIVLIVTLNKRKEKTERLSGLVNFRIGVIECKIYKKKYQFFCFENVYEI